MTTFVATTNLVKLTEFSSHVGGTFINDATVTVTITDADGTTMEGDGWPAFPLTVDYVAGSDGEYRAVLPDTMPLVARRSYVAHVTADGGADRKGQWRVPFRPEIRRE